MGLAAEQQGTDAIVETSAPNSRVFTVAKGLYNLTKPGITRMVVLSTTVGYYLGIRENLEALADPGRLMHFLNTVTGTVLVCSASCVVNAIVEKDRDALMRRTQSRATVNGDVTPLQAWSFAGVLLAVGLTLLWFISLPVFSLALATFLLYVLVYTPMKPRTTWSLYVGAIPGALPPLGGWVAASSDFGFGGWIVFAILFFWQLPHFLSLSWLYRRDYAAGGFRMKAVIDTDGKSLGVQTFAFTVVLFAVSLALLFSVSGWLYGAGAVLLGGYFMVMAYRFMREGGDVLARKVLLASYAHLTGLFLLMFIDKV